MTRDRLLFYCQHSLGLGHLARSLRLAEGLTERFDVRLLNGGRFPAGTTVPAGVSVLNLPPLGHDADSQLVSHDPAYQVEQACARRTELLLAALDEARPAVLLIEMYPFGRRKFEFELVPLLDAVAALGADRPRVVCSLRDILVQRATGQRKHDERAVTRLNASFDAIVMHADPAFATLEESFQPATPLRVPVHYTGFVAPPAPEPVTRPACTGWWSPPAAAWSASRWCGPRWRCTATCSSVPGCAPPWWPGRSCPSRSGPGCASRPPTAPCWRSCAGWTTWPARSPAPRCR